MSNQTGMSTLLLGPPPHRQRRARTAFPAQALQRLEQAFQDNQYPDITAREELSEELEVPEARIQTWFQNKRSRTKRHIRKDQCKPGSPQSQELDSEVQSVTSLPENLTNIKQAHRVAKSVARIKMTPDTSLKPAPVTRNWLLPSSEDTQRSHTFQPLHSTPMSQDDTDNHEKDVFIKTWLENCALSQRHNHMLQAYMHPFIHVPYMFNPLHPLYYSPSPVTASEHIKFPVAKNLTPLFRSPPPGSPAPSPILPSYHPRAAMLTDPTQQTQTHTGHHDNATLTDDVTAEVKRGVKEQAEDDLDVCN